ncbi:hypothetical protein [Halosimplex halobium]|uniref:hypothetical protein n=1 Tax=Halosimplex halobium TaxID=3396618 RepID=UPI003F579E4C
MTRDGEVAVRQHGQETAVATPGLGETVLVDADGDEPTVHVPTGVAVEYHDGAGDELKTDGGRLADRTEVAAEGFGLEADETRRLAYISAVLFVATGWTASSGNAVMTGLVGLAAVVIGGLACLALRSGPA